MNEDALIVIIVFLCIFCLGMTLMFIFALDEYGRVKKKYKKIRRKYNKLCDYLEEKGGYEK